MKDSKGRFATFTQVIWVMLTKNMVSRWIVRKVTPGKTMTKVATRMGVMFGIIAVSLSLIGYGYEDKQIIVNQVQAQVISIVATDKFEAKIEVEKMKVVKTIEDCERMNFTEADGLTTIDNNSAGTLKGEDVFSHGLLQFKVKTVKYFVKMRDGKVITSKEAIELALDKSEAEELAKFVIFDVKDGARNWLNCSNKYNVVAQVALIKNIEK